jgi:DNA-nicking Smr family endonuclease
MVKPRSHRHVESPEADDADASIFRAAVRDVKPLTQAQAPAAGLQKPRKRRRVAPDGGDSADPLPLLPQTAAAEDIIGGADALSFQRPGVRTQVMRRLRRGLYPIEGDLDLHGLGQAEARDRLAEFIALSRDARRRCVRIVHGKGYRSGARGPILKMAVNMWLKRLGDVMAFTSARTIDGGTGAVYVLLRA